MRPILGTTLLLICLLPAMAAGNIIQAGTAVVGEVTVYLEGAEIVRHVRFDVPRGASTVVIAEVPAAIEASSIRASIVGPRAIVRSIELADVGENVALKEAAQAITDLEDQIVALDATRTDDKDLRGYLESAAKAHAANDGAGGADPATLNETYDLLEQRFGVLRERGLDRRAMRRDLDHQLTEAKKKRTEMARAAQSRPATVRVEAEDAGPGTLELRYFVSQAGWQPTYRGTLDDDGDLHIVADARVRQWTDEDWTNVRLKLSTVAPSPSLSPPRLDPWLIRPWEPSYESDYAIEETISISDASQQQNTIVPPQALRTPRPTARLDLASTANQTSFSVTYDVPGEVTVAQGGTPRAITIWDNTLPSTVAYRIKPVLDSTAYLEATIRAPQDVPLLAGSMSLYSGNTLIGSHELPETGPGETRVIPFGADPRLSVTRTTRDISEGRQGAIRRQRREQRAYRTTITNHRTTATKLTVEDRMPVAEDERIEVTLSSNTTAGHSPSKNRRGVLLWILDLAPGETRVIDFGYEVRYPADLVLEGMDVDT